MDSRGQTSIEYLILIAGVVLLVVIVGYFLTQGALHEFNELNDVGTDIFD